MEPLNAIIEQFPRLVNRDRPTLNIEPPAENPPTFQSSRPACRCSGNGFYVEKGYAFECDCRKMAIYQGRLRQIPEHFKTASLETYIPKSLSQAEAKQTIAEKPDQNYFLHGPYGSGKTHLLYSQFRIVAKHEKRCSIRTTRQIIQELQRQELNSDCQSDITDNLYCISGFHLFWDDADKFKVTDFRMDILFDLIDTIYRRNLSISVTSNMTLAELQEKVGPAIVRRLDDMCRVVSL